jgi:hypothetical protein
MGKQQEWQVYILAKRHGWHNSADDCSAACQSWSVSFFFKKGEGERNNASRFFTTIAVDLVAHELYEGRA